MTAGDLDDSTHKRNTFHFDRHAPDYREHFGEITRELQAKCRSRGAMPMTGTG
ncbi:MAG: hypothetical protein JWM19_6952 [Actinomycetia bacterium]|nr:hypothetical protein [Actinomycetes bacterium]